MPSHAVQFTPKPPYLSSYLNNNKLEGSIPSSIALLPYLAYLCLSHNSLTASLDDLPPLTNLRVLELSSNAISGPIPTTLREILKVQNL
ncbi:unnamed protein product [Closterium sp. NIES-54]